MKTYPTTFMARVAMLNLSAFLFFSVTGVLYPEIALPALYALAYPAVLIGNTLISGSLLAMCLKTCPAVILNAYLWGAVAMLVQIAFSKMRGKRPQFAPHR